VIKLRTESCDLLYNAPDGFRGRYWQSPDHGFSATKHLIGVLLPKLVSFAKDMPPAPDEKAAPMTIDDIKASLEATSAKIWPRERDDSREWLLSPDKLIVPRWADNEQCADGHSGMWRQSPKGGELEIKGAILGKDRAEYLPNGKRDRSCQIHRFGFT
jgi:hypothetical protein